MSTEPMSEQRLSEIEAIANAATRGPWEAWSSDGKEWNVAAPDGDCIAHKVCGNLGMDEGTDDEDVARFVAESRTAVPELIDEVRRLRLALGLKDGDTLISGENGEFIADDKCGNRRRVNMLQPEMRELESRRAASPSWHDRPTGPGRWLLVTQDGRFSQLIVDADDMGHWADDVWEMGRVFGPIPADEEGK